MNQTFNEYLVSKFNQTQADCCVDGITETVLPMGGGEENRIVVFYPKGMLSLSVFYGTFEDRHQKAMYAFIDSYNEREDREYELRSMNNQIWIEVEEGGVDDQKAIEIIEKVMAFFADDGEFVKTFRNLKTSARARWTTINKRAQTLRERACVLENNGYHQEAMECLTEICELYYGYKHMELIALYYLNDFKRTHPAMKFPHKPEYALECLLMAIEKNPTDMFHPIIAARVAQELGKTDLVARMNEIAQQRGSWEYLALHNTEGDAIVKRLQKIADFYRNGVGCEQSERNASYYGRLALGERQEVFKDMLHDGFERVFLLMSDVDYYHIASLSELNGLSDDFKQRFLYGDADDEFTLTPWFVPMVNGLNEADRELVLAEVKAKLEASLERLFKRVESGEFEVVIPADERRGVLFETPEKWRYIYPICLNDLVGCEGKAVLDRLMDAFKQFN